ncbi:MAG: hypothetical protein AAF483_13835 [Planctomycetota bacterium]
MSEIAEFTDLENKVLEAERFVASLTGTSREAIIEGVVEMAKGSANRIHEARRLIDSLKADAPKIERGLVELATKISTDRVEAKNWVLSNLDGKIAEIALQAEQVANKIQQLQNDLGPLINGARDKLALLVIGLENGMKSFASVSSVYVGALKASKEDISENVVEVVASTLSDCAKNLSDIKTIVESGVEAANEQVLQEITESTEEICESAKDEAISVVENAISDVVAPLVVDIREMLDEAVEELVDALMSLVAGSEDQNGEINEVTEALDPILEPLLQNVEIMSAV